MFKTKNRNGFTLIEILVVVATIGLLAILVILLLMRNITKANDAKRKADISKISTALEEYYTDNNCYPDPSVFSQCGSSALKPYLSSVPCDPVYKYPYCYFTDEAYPTSTCFQKYRALATLKYLKDPVIKSLGCDGSGYCGWESECNASADRYGFNYGVASRNTYLANPNYVPGVNPPPSLPPTDGPGKYACSQQGVCNDYGSYGAAIGPDHLCPATFSSSDCQNMCGNINLRCKF